MSAGSDRCVYVCLDNIAAGYPMMRGFRAIPAEPGRGLLTNAMKAFGIRSEVEPHLEIWTSSSRWTASARRLDTMDTVPDDVEFVFLYARDKAVPRP